MEEKIVLIGNVVDGFEAHGPFSCDEVLDDFLNGYSVHLIHAVMDLIVPPYPPTEDEEGEE